MRYASNRSVLLIVIFALVIINLSTVPFTFAGIKNQPSPLPNWVHTNVFTDDTAQKHGIVLAGDAVERSSPVIADVDGNLANGKEVVVGGKDGWLYAYKADGNLLWQQKVPSFGCAPGVVLINGKATVGQIFGDTMPYVLIGYGPMTYTNRVCDGGVVAYRGSDGALAWNFSQRDFDNANNPDLTENLYGVITAPALADVDGNGSLEVGLGGLDRNVYMLNSNGSVRWYYHAADTVWSTPIFMNMDADPSLEMIVATDITANPLMIPPTHDGGFLHAFDTHQRSPLEIPFQTGFIWRTPFEQVLYSSPIEADLLPAQPGTEIAIGSGCYFPIGDPNKLGRWIKIVRPSDGVVLQTLNAPACVQSSPAVGDINEDGTLEIVATVSGDVSIGGDGKSDVVAWNPTNPNPIWSMSPGDPNSGSNDGHGGDLQSPVIADLDGNGSLEVIVANFWSVHVLQGKTGVALTCQGPGCAQPFSLFTWGTLKSTPAVGDINNDGKLDLVIGGMNIFNPNRGQLYAWTDFASSSSLSLGSIAGTKVPYNIPWPQFRRDAVVSGVYVAPGIVPSSASVGLLMMPADTRTVAVAVNSADSSPFNWTATMTSNPTSLAATPLLTLLKSTGVAGEAVQFQVKGDGRVPGTYSATMDITVPGLPTKTITVSVIVAENVLTTHIPLLRR